MKIQTPILTAVAVSIVAVACVDPGPDVPVSIAHPNPAAPHQLGDGLVAYPTPAESLFVHDAAGAGGSVELVFHRGRGTARDSDGRAFVPDPMASRVLIVGRGMEVSGVQGGPGTDGGGLAQPLSAAPVPGGGLFVTDAETAPGLFYFDDDGEFAGAAAPPVTNAEIRAGPEGVVWAARSPYVLRFDETAAGEPLLFRFDPLSGEGVGIASIEPVADPTWNRVANAGAVAVGEDGTGFFGFFLRNELRAYTPDGELLWRTTRVLDPAAAADTMMRPVTQALSMGPDGLLYALTVPDSLPDLGTGPVTTGARRVEVYDPRSGALVRATTVPAAWSTFGVDRHGALFHFDPDAIEATAPVPERRPLPDVTLATFEGDSARFTDWSGKALLVNFWASWCVPCQRELPQLKAFYQTLDHERVEFLGISADETRGAAVEFIGDFELPFPQFYGGMEMQTAFGFFGLPYTIVVDPRGQIVEEIYGFGNPETWEYLKGVLAEEMERVVVAPAGDDPSSDSDAAPAQAHEHD
ncbi:MAG: TlpA family protein disulfide reductase [Gemmatimonadota bacterium]|nr:TlpA family protein disulfide reductase [Gemmatimonadota bacterium]